MSPCSFRFDSEKRSCGGAKMERVPVPVRSGRNSPVDRIVRIRLRYWYSSCSFLSWLDEEELVDCGGISVAFPSASMGGPRTVAAGVAAGSGGGTADGDMIALYVCTGRDGYMLTPPQVRVRVLVETM